MHASPYVIDATDVDFQQKVLLRSQEVPVLVDFWAEWCGPCKTLGPILEKLAVEYDGAFELVKVDVDRSPQVASVFRIQSIPTVFLVIGGQPVDGFQGAQTEPAIRQMLERHQLQAAADPLDMADEALAAGRPDLAEQAFRHVLAEQPTESRALIGLAKIAMGQGRTDEAGSLLARVPMEDARYDEAQRLKGVMDFAADAGDEAALRAKIEANPKDAEAWYGLGATLASQGRIDAACEAFLKVVQTDREYRDDGGRKALLSLFALSDPEDPAVVTWRRRLAAQLF
jgi:putative thioredoxin